MGKFFQKAGEKISVLTMHEALQQANSSLKRNIPPHDVTASTHEKAYIFDEIITVEEQNCLDDIELLKSAIGNKVKINELREQRAYPEFVLQRLHTMKHLQDEQKNKGIVILSYLKHLLAFYRLPRHLINSIVDPMGSQAKLSGSNSIDLTRYANIPDAVAGKILKLFTTVSEDMTSESEARTQTDEKRDLLINYILVLGLMVDNYRADPYDLGVELKKTISQLRPYYLELGCKFKSVKEADRGVAEPKTSLQRLYEITLPLPLRFPTLKNKKRRV
ncbi:hypothetical protein KP509_38G068000 [Ceratopteris richardii]|nr:hypothetical protein KP509_38G068000 [Ceratopteris richardii]